MNTIEKIEETSKSELMAAVNEYARISNNIGGIIKGTGYKYNFIAKKLKMPTSTFYQKKRTKTFTVDEITKIVGMLSEDETDTLLDLAKNERVLMQKWIEEFMSIPAEYRCNPFECSPSGDLYFADKRNVEGLKETIREARNEPMQTLTKEDQLQMFKV